MRIDIQNDGLVDYTTLGTSDLVGQRDNVALDLIGEVVKLFTRDLLKNTPWLSVLILNVIQTELKWSSCDDTLNKIFE